MFIKMSANKEKNEGHVPNEEKFELSAPHTHTHTHFHGAEFSVE